MLSFLLISIHFWGQLGRPAQFYPDLGTGIVLYIVMVLLVWTGFSERFQILPKLGRKWKFLHINMATAFYLVILVHILHGLGLL
jgi:DMSO/TMAO reductase YedYZ heme-binding membrane subunit